MISFLFPSRAIMLLVLISASFFVDNAFSQAVDSGKNSDEVTPVVIIGTRFPNAPDSSPIGATIITAKEMQQAGMNNVNEAIRKLAGVYGRNNVRGTRDFDLDMNGFGLDSANNVVILVDGVRLSESEQTVALLSSIPIDSVARIEIMRGGSSVLYGDGATGGVIEIITKEAGKTPWTGSVTAEIGQSALRSGRVWLGRGWDAVNLSLNLSDQHADNYRTNNTVIQKNASGAVTWFYGKGGRAGWRFDSARQDSGFPGALSLAEFEQNPRQSVTPSDKGFIRMERYTAFVDQEFGAWQAAAEVLIRNRTSHSDFVSLQSTSTYAGRQTQFTPRLRNESRWGSLRNEFVVGLDFMSWNRRTTSNYSLDDATQKSSGIYFRNELKVDRARLALGARREVFDKTSRNPLPTSADNYDVVQGVNAWEVQGSYAFFSEANGFAKWGQSYRVANSDDNSYVTTPNAPLLPQLSHDIEVGTLLGSDVRQITLRYFRHDMVREIYFDPLINNGLGANTNLDPTRRQGVALEAKFRLSKQFKFNAQAQHVRAAFSSGVNEGRELVLVPRNTISAHLNWLPANDQNAYVGVQWVDRQRYGGDFANTCGALIPSHLTLDARYSRTFGNWELAVVGSNLTNKSYFTNAFGCMSGIYPDDGRQVRVSLRYGF